MSGGAVLAALGTAACGPDGNNSSPAAGSSSSPGTVSAPPASGVLAANVNQALEKIDYAELQAVSGTWIRGFYLMSNADQGNPATQTGFAKLLQAAAHGYGTVLTTKFQYQNRPIPTPGSPAMTTALARLDKVLAATMGKVDILTIGNEPFFETSKTDRETPRINTFYEALALHTAQYRQKHFGANCKTKIYMGALTALYRPGAETAQTRRWMTFTAHTPSIAGVDIHPHVPGPAAAKKYLDYVLPFLRSDQRFLATEFSLVQLWKQHMSDAVNPAFARSHGIAKGTPVWQVIKDATQRPFDEQEWNDFLLSNTWYADNKNFLADQMERFRSTGKLAVAAYGITQASAMPKDFGPNSTPWVLNSMFCPYVCKPEPSGLPGRNRTWCRQFRALQHYRA
ncbi:hypothetical protein [Actinoallomurus soli]|uniref:hypothetical protein n=1 Tax=Actinoallomurus soli TaxID=2952535 RepID=UPI002093E909|nr:hypothetical protein [Actinoallomurus soli]MCO5970935.1 hypothetical protein [Actinoallomurus soli]